MPDHIHILVGYNLNQSVPDLVEKIKTSSNHWIEDRKFTQYKFHWQKGYGAFSYSRSQIDSVAKYVLNQEDHHRKHTFKDEYIETLLKFEIDYKDEYLFDFINETKD